MERFAIRAELVTPAIISMLTLDGLLGALLFEELQDVDQAHAAIPLQCTDGLYHASMALPDGANMQRNRLFENAAPSCLAA